MFRPISLLAATLITLAALAPLAQVHATTQTITINQSHTFDGITVTVTGSITIDTTAKTITGSITVKAVNNTSGQTIFQNTFPINVIFSSTSGNFVLMIPTVGGVLSANCSQDGTCTVSRSPDVNHDGSIDISDLSSVALAYNSVSGTPRYNPAYDLDNDGRIDIGDLATIALYYHAQVIW